MDVAEHPLPNRDLKTLWRTFDRGDHLTNAELKRLEKSVREGLAYLQARGERLAVFKTVADLNAIEGYIRARKNA